MDITLATIIATFTALLSVTATYFISLKIRDASIIDIAWGLGFVLIALSLYLTVDPPSATQTLLMIFVSIWGARLTIHIGRRKIGKPEDWRYAQWRKDWGKNFWWMSYFRIFLLQAALMTMVASPIIISAQSTDASIGLLGYIGAMLWVFGFLFETTADWQLDSFLKQRKLGHTKQKIMTSGLWKYTRHPNYFGEVTLWWGLGLMSVSLPHGWLGVIGPLVISFIILGISMPMLERKYSGDKDFQSYAKRTSIFIPLLPRS
ncbi:MAG: DUF1295 domain-containing protein [Patescibacteria group bacterium]